MCTMLSKPDHDTLQSETMRVRVEMQPAASAHGAFPVANLDRIHVINFGASVTQQGSKHGGQSLSV